MRYFLLFQTSTVLMSLIYYNGWSSGSGICSYLLTTEPDLIRSYILAGSGIGKSFETLIKEKITKSYFQNNIFLYVNTEEGPRESGLIRFNKTIESINPNRLIRKFEIVKKSHLGAMQIELVEGLKFIFSDFYIPTEEGSKGFEEVQNYYNEVKNKYNFEFDIPVVAINESSGILYYQNKKDDAIKLLNYGIELYPFSATLYGSLAEIYKTDHN